MNWITTNIRLPEDDYFELKIEAARRRKSIAALIRERVFKKPAEDNRKYVDKLIREMDSVAKEIAKQNKGRSLSKALIEMRYEQ